MTTPEVGRRAPGAAPYEVMPAYQATSELFLGLDILAGRIGPRPDGLDRALVRKTMGLLLATAEGGARPETWRRALNYRYAWFGTYDVAALLRDARDQRLVPADATLGTDALFRMAQQALTITAGTIMEREREARGTDPPAR